MKKLLAFILAMLLLISLVACANNQNSNDDDEERDDKPAQQKPSQSDPSEPEASEPSVEDLFEWEYTGEGVKITRYTGNDTHVVIPDVIDNKKVVSIGNTFAGNVTLETLVLSKYIDTVSRIDFYGCDTLKRLEGPGVTYFDGIACKSLEEMILPSLRSLDTSDIRSCESLRYIEIPNVSSVDISYYEKGSVCFYQLDSVEELVLPEKMYIGKYYDDWSGDLFFVFLCDAEYVNEVNASDNAERYKFEELTQEKAVDIYSEIFTGDKITVNGKVYMLN